MIVHGTNVEILQSLEELYKHLVAQGFSHTMMGRAKQAIVKGHVGQDESKLFEWLQETYEPDQVFGNRDILYYVQCNFNITDVFDHSDVTEYATENGYRRDRYANNL